MPTPPPTVDGPHPNPDGSNTTVTTTTTYHPNGSDKSITKEIKTANGDVREETVDEYEKGTAPGEGFRGDKKRSRKTTTDDRNREASYEDTKFKDGKKRASFSRMTDWRRRPPRREIAETIYCPDGTTIKKSVKRVFYKRERRWHEETREREKEARDCRTGRRIVLSFPGTTGGYTALALAALALTFAGLGWSEGDSGRWALGFVCLAAAAAFYVGYERRRCEQEVEVVEVYRTLFELDDANESLKPDEKEPQQEESPAGEQ